MNPGIEALCELTHIGYRFTLNGGKIKAKYHGAGEPDRSRVSPLLEVVREHKEEVLQYLSQKTQVPQDHTLTCFECGHFSPGKSPNPTQAWGWCQKLGRGRFGVAVACGAVMDGVGPADASLHG